MRCPVRHGIEHREVGAGSGRRPASAPRGADRAVTKRVLLTRVNMGRPWLVALQNLYPGGRERLTAHNAQFLAIKFVIDHQQTAPTDSDFRGDDCVSTSNGDMGYHLDPKTQGT